MSLAFRYICSGSSSLCLLTILFFSVLSNANAVQVHFVQDNATIADADGSFLDMPRDMLPAWGECRAWKPGIDPSKASKPGRCGNLAQRVLPGAWLVHGPRDNDREIKVWVFSTERGGVEETRWFDKETMELLRVDKVERKAAESPPEE